MSLSDCDKQSRQLNTVDWAFKCDGHTNQQRPSDNGDLKQHLIWEIDSESDKIDSALLGVDNG